MYKVANVQHRAFYYIQAPAYGSDLWSVTLVVWTESGQLITVTLTSPTASIQQVLLTFNKVSVYLVG